MNHFDNSELISNIEIHSNRIAQLKSHRNWAIAGCILFGALSFFLGYLYSENAKQIAKLTSDERKYI